MDLKEYRMSSVHDLCQIVDTSVYLKQDVDELISRYDSSIQYYQSQLSYYQKELNEWVDECFKKNRYIAYLEMIYTRLLARYWKIHYMFASFNILQRFGISNRPKERYEKWCDKYTELFRKKKESYLLLTKSTERAYISKGGTTYVKVDDPIHSVSIDKLV